MDFVTLGVAAVGLGISLYGTYEKYEGSTALEQQQEKMIYTEMQENNLRRQMMEMSAKREGMELMRNAQRARSLAIAGAAQHGAQFGSGLQGGYGQISGATNTQGLKISEDLQAGEKMFDLKAQEDQIKIMMAKAGQQINIGSGIMDIGKVISAGQTPIASLIKQSSSWDLFGQSVPDASYEGADVG